MNELSYSVHLYTLQIYLQPNQLITSFEQVGPFLATEQNGDLVPLSLLLRDVQHVAPLALILSLDSVITPSFT